MGKLAEILGALFIAFCCAYGLWKFAMAWARGLDESRAKREQEYNESRDKREQEYLDRIYPTKRKTPTTERPPQPRSQTKKTQEPKV